MSCMQTRNAEKGILGSKKEQWKYFNRRYGRVGHVFQQRYKAQLCDDEAYLITLVCYIHQNPSRAGMQEGLNYPWSSHREYIRGYGQYVNSHFVLGMLSMDIKQAIKMYIEKISETHTVLLAENELVANGEFSEINISELQKTESEGTEHYSPCEALENLAKQVAEEMNVSLENLLGRCRIRRVVEARNLLIYRAVEARICTKAELAIKLRVDPARITRGYQQVDCIKKSIT